MPGDIVERSSTATSQGPQGLTLEKPATEVQAPQPQMQEQPSFEVPEKFRDKPAEEVIKSYLEVEKKLTGLAQSLSEERRKAALYEAQLRMMQQQPQVPTTQPSPADQGLEISNDLFWEKPVEAIEKLIDATFHKRTQVERQMQERQAQERQNQINAIEQAEIAQIQYEDPTFDRERYALMHDIAQREPQVIAGLQDPGQILRKLNDRAKEVQKQKYLDSLRTLGIDPDAVSAYEQARKQAANAGLPASGNSNGGVTPGKQYPSKDYEKWVNRLSNLRGRKS